MHEHTIVIGCDLASKRDVMTRVLLSQGHHVVVVDSYFALKEELADCIQHTFPLAEEPKQQPLTYGPQRKGARGKPKRW